jgi:hypothetical protein
MAEASESDLGVYHKIQRAGAHHDLIPCLEMQRFHVADQRLIDLALEVINHPGAHIYRCDAKAGCFRR